VERCAAGGGAAVARSTAEATSVPLERAHDEGDPPGRDTFGSYHLAARATLSHELAHVGLLSFVAVASSAVLQ
jgi:hypothetical protein